MQVPDPEPSTVQILLTAVESKLEFSAPFNDSGQGCQTESLQCHFTGPPGFPTW